MPTRTAVTLAQTSSLGHPPSAAQRTSDTFEALLPHELSTARTIHAVQRTART